MPGNEPFQLFTRCFLCVFTQPRRGNHLCHCHNSAASERPGKGWQRCSVQPLQAFAALAPSHRACHAAASRPVSGRRRTDALDYAGEVKYPEIIAQTKQKGIVINTIQCGAMTRPPGPGCRLPNQRLMAGQSTTTRRRYNLLPERLGFQSTDNSIDILSDPVLLNRPPGDYAIEAGVISRPRYRYKLAADVYIT